MDATTRRIVDYARALQFDSLSAETVHETKRRFIDVLGCALGAYDDAPSRIARGLAGRVRAESGARILGTDHRTLPELATFSNSVMGRYLDGNDTFPGGGGHPSDTMTAVLAMAETAGADGKALITAMVLAYEVYHAFFDAVVMREHGMDHALYTAIGSAVGAAKILDLDEARMAEAVALAITPNLPLHATRRGDLSMWKGCAAGNGARNGVFAALMAADGMTGPDKVIDGSDGLGELVNGFELGALAAPGDAFKVTQSNIKYFLSEYHSQAPITAAIKLSRDVKPEEIESITVHTYWFAWSEIGSEPEKWHPTTRESADHSLPYIVSAVLIDGAFSDAIFSEARIKDPQVHALADKVSVEEDPAYTECFPASVPCRVEVRTRGGAVMTEAVDYPRGHIGNPMTDEEVEGKFRALAGKLLPAAQLDTALTCLWKIDEAPAAAVVLDALCKR